MTKIQGNRYVKHPTKKGRARVNGGYFRCRQGPIFQNQDLVLAYCLLDMLGKPIPPIGMTFEPFPLDDLSQLVSALEKS